MHESLLKSKEIASNLFISQYCSKFNKFLTSIDSTSKHIIRNNKQLSDMYDLFLDFIIDGGQHLDYQQAKETEKDIDY